MIIHTQIHTSIDLTTMTPVATVKVQPRSKGVHLSGVLRAVAIKLGKLDAKYGDDPISDKEMKLRMALGLAWEDFMARTLIPTGMVWQPGEQCVDGIYFTPDGITPWGQWIPNKDRFVRERLRDGWKARSGVGIVEEFKVTWGSSRYGLSDAWLYLSQVQAECNCYKTFHARLHILYVNGNYDRVSEVPQLVTYWLQFTREECEGTWRMVTRNRAVATPEPAWTTKRKVRRK